MPLEQFLHALEYANGATGIEPTVGRVIALLKEQQVTTTRRLAKLMVGRVGVSFCVIVCSVAGELTGACFRKGKSRGDGPHAGGH